ASSAAADRSPLRHRHSPVGCANLSVVIRLRYDPFQVAPVGLVPTAGTSVRVESTALLPSRTILQLTSHVLRVTVRGGQDAPREINSPGEVSRGELLRCRLVGRDQAEHPPKLETAPSARRLVGHDINAESAHVRVFSSHTSHPIIRP